MRAVTALGVLNGLALILFVSGCSTPKSEPVYLDVPAASPTLEEAASPSPADVPSSTESATKPATASAAPELIVTPDESLTGSVVSVNEVGRFVVLQFPLGRMPAEDATLFVYRQGMKVAELKVTGPQKDDHTVADIQSGDCRVADAVRNR
jgi:hypothetical protein